MAASWCFTPCTPSPLTKSPSALPPLDDPGWVSKGLGWKRSQRSSSLRHVQIPKDSALQQLPPTLGVGLRPHFLKSHQPGAPSGESQLPLASVASSVKWTYWILIVLSRVDNGVTEIKHVKGPTQPPVPDGPQLITFPFSNVCLFTARRDSSLTPTLPFWLPS